MKVSNQKNPLHRPQSPTLSDGSNPKRLHLGSDDLDPDEKFEKLRRIDSPTETSPRLGMQFSPQIGGMSLSGKGSPKDNPNKRSVSPKALYPPSIQKFLNGKSTLTIEEAIEKLKVPSNKTHKGQLEKMKMLGAFQKQEVASNVAFRKAYSNSPASVSPARSTSPVGSPMVISPRHDNMSNFQESENIVMTFEDESDGPLSGAGLMESAMGKMNFPKQNVDNWLSNMGVQGNNGMFQQDNHQQGHFNNNSRPQQSNMQMNQGNFGGNNSMQGGQRPPFNQFQQNSNNNNNQSGRYQSLTPQALAFLNSQSQDQGDYRDRGSRYEDDESRERTNSFLRLPRDLANPPESNYRSLAETQLNAIQSIMKATRAISPTEPNRGVMQQFQKRNSNPESMMMNNGPMQMQMQQPLFENRPSAFNQGMMQDFNTGYNGGMQQQYSQYNNNMHQQGQGMFSMQNQHQMHMDNGYNNQNNMTKREYAPQQQQQQHPTPYGGYGQGPNMGMQGHESKQGMGTYNDQMAWNMQNQLSGDPEAFLFEKNETEDFDLNIIPSDLNFMPNRQGMEELADPNDNNLIVPDPTGMDPFFNNGPHGMFRFSS